MSCCLCVSSGKSSIQRLTDFIRKFPDVFEFKGECVYLCKEEADTRDPLSPATSKLLRSVLYLGKTPDMTLIICSLLNRSSLPSFRNFTALLLQHTSFIAFIFSSGAYSFTYGITEVYYGTFNTLTSTYSLQLYPRCFNFNSNCNSRFNHNSSVEL